MDPKLFRDYCGTKWESMSLVEPCSSTKLELHIVCFAISKSSYWTKVGTITASRVGGRKPVAIVVKVLHDIESFCVSAAIPFVLLLSFAISIAMSFKVPEFVAAVSLTVGRVSMFRNPRILDIYQELLDCYLLTYLMFTLRCWTLTTLEVPSENWRIIAQFLWWFLILAAYSSTTQ